MDIGNGINSGVGAFSFNKDVATVFGSHVEKSVPFYKVMHQMVCDLSDWFLIDGNVAYDIGASTGELVEALSIRHLGRDVDVVGVEASEDMYDIATEKNLMPNAYFINKDISDPKFCIENAGLISSVLTMQFIEPKKKLEVFKKIYGGLNNGSAFILFEKVRAENSLVNEIYRELHTDFKIKQGLTAEQTVNKTRSLRGVMFPNTTTELHQLLSNAGFSNIETIFKFNNFIGILAIKQEAVTWDN